MKLDEKTIKERIMRYLLSQKAPVASLPWLREEVLQYPEDEVELEEFDRAIEELLETELEWEDESTLTVQLRTRKWKAARKRWK